MDVLTSTATIVNPEITSAVNDLLVTGIRAGMLALVAALTWGVKLGINSIKSSWKRQLAERLVKFAYQRITPNEEKRKYVAVKLREKIKRLSEEEAEQLVEEAVVNLKKGLAGN